MGSIILFLTLLGFVQTAAYVISPRSSAVLRSRSATIIVVSICLLLFVRSLLLSKKTEAVAIDQKKEPIPIAETWRIRFNDTANGDRIDGLWEGQYRVRKGLLYGAHSQVGDELIAPQYLYLSHNLGGRRIACTIDNHWIVLDDKGTILSDTEYEAAMIHSSGWVAVKEPHGWRTWQDKDKNKDPVQVMIDKLLDFSPRYDDFQFLNDSLALVYMGYPEWHVIRRGEETQNAYTKPPVYKDGRIYGQHNDHSWIIHDVTINYLDMLSIEADSIYPASAAPFRARKGKLFGYVSLSDGWMVEPQWKRAFDFSDGLARVWNGKKYGYINDIGIPTIPYRYAEAGDFGNGLAPVREGKRCGYINKRGEIAIPLQFIDAMPFHNERAWVRLPGDDTLADGTWRCINTMGQEMFKIVCAGAVWPFSWGRAWVLESCNSQRYGAVDISGRWVIPAAYDYIRPFEQGVATVQTKDPFTKQYFYEKIDVDGFVRQPAETREVLGW